MIPECIHIQREFKADDGHNQVFALLKQILKRPTGDSGAPTPIFRLRYLLIRWSVYREVCWEFN